MKVVSPFIIIATETVAQHSNKLLKGKLQSPQKQICFSKIRYLNLKKKVNPE